MFNPLSATLQESDVSNSTNASIALSSDKKSAKLSLGSQNMNVILRSPTTATFGTAQPVSTPAVTLPTGGVDLPNNGVTVLTINVAGMLYL